MVGVTTMISIKTCVNGHMREPYIVSLTDHFLKAVIPKAVPLIYITRVSACGKERHHFTQSKWMKIVCPRIDRLGRWLLSKFILINFQGHHVPEDSSPSSTSKLPFYCHLLGEMLRRAVWVTAFSFIWLSKSLFSRLSVQYIRFWSMNESVSLYNSFLQLLETSKIRHIWICYNHTL